MKKLAVLMPTYNAAVYLKDSIESVLNQTFTDFDFYIYDDCSTDHTAEIIVGYKKETRIYYRKNPLNLGIAKTLNKGLEELLPNYKFIARMDADDWAYPERFKKQLNYLEQYKDVILCGTQGYWLKDITQNPVSGWEYPTTHHNIKKYLLFGACFGHSSVVFRSDFFQKYKFRYNETIHTCEDWDLWIRIIKLGNVANLPYFLMKYRILENSNHRSHQKTKIHLEERSKIISEYWANFNISFSNKDVFEYYYDEEEISKKEFISKSKNLISAFNKLYKVDSQILNLQEKNKFSYLLARRILNYWKRSKVSRIDLLLWVFLIKEVKFVGTFKLIKSIIR